MKKYLTAIRKTYNPLFKRKYGAPDFCNPELHNLFQYFFNAVLRNFYFFIRYHFVKIGKINLFYGLAGKTGIPQKRKSISSDTEACMIISRLRYLVTSSEKLFPIDKICIVTPLLLCPLHIVYYTKCISLSRKMQLRFSSPALLQRQREKDYFRGLKL